MFKAKQEESLFSPIRKAGGCYWAMMCSCLVEQSEEKPSWKRH